MLVADAYQMGYAAAALGFFFDGQELVAMVSVDVGGFDGLRGALEPIFAERDVANGWGDDLARYASAAFGQSVAPPRSVDGYRTLLTEGVFEIVNRWSFIGDLGTVNRLQAWFYAGFGMGRARTVLRASALHERMLEIAPTHPAVLSMRGQVQRLCQEAVRQIEVASEEDDLRSVRPLLQDVANRMKRWSVLLLRAPHERIVFDADAREDLAVLEALAERITRDLVAPGLLRG